jgi:hypothetical protein
MADYIHLTWIRWQLQIAGSCAEEVLQKILNEAFDIVPGVQSDSKWVRKSKGPYSIR